MFFSHRIAELIQTRLVDSGWRDQVRLTCREALVEHTNHRIPTLEELVSIVTPKARSMVPDSVKRELLHELELISVNIDKAATTFPKRM